MSSVLDSALKGTLKDLDYPVTAGDPPKEKATDVVLFVIGGATYQEAREAAQMSAEANVSVILGTTSMVNSVKFLGDVTYYGGLTGHAMPMASAMGGPVTRGFDDIKFH